ncbi:hypothetical protein EAI_01860 [Harpegnathos saltator]|uniref:Uncharacterized protein n=1 Tax=Harpegnathos saltator TaxID=610380 RepID=E2BL48_HARSA|nr:hypothetical protein EAI_01860 [Harpegnathos saltator]
MPLLEVFSTDEQTVLQNRGCEPGMFSLAYFGRKHNRLTHWRSHSSVVAESLISGQAESVLLLEPDVNEHHHVTFSDSAAELVSKAGGPLSLTQELFGESQSLASNASWDSLILQATKSEIRSGLQEDLRQAFLARYEPSGDLSYLGPPKMNKELISALGKYPSVLKKDGYQVRTQIQVGACLHALGSGLSELLQFQHSCLVDERAKSAFTKLAEGIHLLADLQFRLSLTRQAFIKPCLTFGKSAADSSAANFPC